MPMRHLIVIFLLFSCGGSLAPVTDGQPAASTLPSVRTTTEAGTWPYFLQHLKIVEGPILDYRGQPVADQEKGAGIIPYDVGKSDLQQCADALMRLRAEYLFEQKRHGEIAFHFVSGDRYRYTDYLAGKRPKASGNRVVLVNGAAQPNTHASLRKYLDYVYMYASTISLARELKKTDRFTIGTIVIYAGSPGHCFIIIDEKEEGGKKLFKLAEGYTPAQSIYVLKNPVDGSSWHTLAKGTINTASYSFTKYEVKAFE
jgi:hypothetical protein